MTRFVWPFSLMPCVRAYIATPARSALGLGADLDLAIDQGEQRMVAAV
jgi:hypothetical protein